MKKVGILFFLILLTGCKAREFGDKSESTTQTKEYNNLLGLVIKEDISSRHQAAADLCIILLKRNNMWKPDPLNWKIPTEDGIRGEVQAVQSSNQEPYLAIANMCAHCMGMIKSGIWRTSPVNNIDPLEKKIISIVKSTNDPVVKTIFLVGLASSPTEIARDVIVDSTADDDLGVRMSVNFLIERCSANYFGPIGVIHSGSSESDVEKSGQKIRMIYKEDKTLSARIDE
jgi:hypothetical protein